MFPWNWMLHYATAMLFTKCRLKSPYPFPGCEVWWLRSHQSSVSFLLHWQALTSLFLSSSFLEISVYLSVSVSVSFYVCLSLFLSLFISLSVSIFLCFSLVCVWYACMHTGYRYLCTCIFKPEDNLESPILSLSASLPWEKFLTKPRARLATRKGPGILRFLIPTVWGLWELI